MAKWGEGDPRWIVEERPDATNVNNWHWSEKNASVWSKEKLKELLNGMVLEEPGVGKVTLEEIKCEGEATANNRKGKLIFFYEWVITIDWKGVAEGDPDKTADGTLEIPNLSEENEPHEVDVNVTIKNGGPTGDSFKEFLRTKGTKQLQTKMGEYISSLQSEYSSGLILPTKGQAVSSNHKTKINCSKQSVNKTPNYDIMKACNDIEKLGMDCKITTSKITLTQNFKCTAEDLYRAFTIREMVVAFTRNDVKMEVEKGGKFVLFGGTVTGEFVELVPGLQIVQKWRFKTWPDGHFSIVTLDFVQKEDVTEIKLTQTGIPTNDVERTKQGWQNYYWEAMKRTFGFGAILI